MKINGTHMVDNTAEKFPEASTQWKLETLGFQTHMIGTMDKEYKIRLHFWDVDPVEIVKVDFLYWIDNVNVGNVNAAIKAYCQHVTPSFMPELLIECDTCGLDQNDCNYDNCDEEPLNTRLSAELADQEERLLRLKEVLTRSGLYEEVKDIFENEITV